MWSYSSLLVGPSIPSCSTQRSSMEEWSKERQSTSATQVLEQMSSGTVRTLIIFVVSRPAWARGEKGGKEFEGCAEVYVCGLGFGVCECENKEEDARARMALNT